MAKKTAQREQRAEETTESDGNQETSAETGAVAPEASAAAADYAVNRQQPGPCKRATCRWSLAGRIR